MSIQEPWVLGISSSHNGSACLMRGREVVVAIQEERLLRYKRAEVVGGGPSLAVTYCLSHAGIKPEHLDAVVLCSAGIRARGRDDVEHNPQLRAAFGRARFFSIPHHLGHAVGAYAASGFDAPGVLVIDGRGSPCDEMLPEEQAVVPAAKLAAASQPDRTVPREIISLYRAGAGRLEPLEKHIASYPMAPVRGPGMEAFASLGDMYGAVGRQIFGSFFEGPGKVMGLAPFGRATIPTEEFFAVTDDGFEFRDTVRARFQHDARWPTNAEAYQDLAASVQRALETAVLHLCRRLRVQGVEDLAYAGGVALNSVANERIVNEAGFRNVFVVPAAEDSGASVGAAYYGLWTLCGYRRAPTQVRDSMGRAYSRAEVRTAIERAPGVEEVSSVDAIERTAALLAERKIVGWFSGGSELGPRALGQRSILCDPRSVEMKDSLNRRVKFREGFRPFAPAILAEDVYDWFDVRPGLGESPFMLRVMRFRSDKLARAGAVAHVDGTGRVQTVSHESNPRLYELLRAFKARTGLPLLLNTSFNIAVEPIVETPGDALASLAYTDIDCCFLEGILVGKVGGSDPVLDHPLLLTALTYQLSGARRPTGVCFDTTTWGDADERIFSAHAGRADDVEDWAQLNPWLELRVRCRSAWGDHVIHGLPRGFAQILTQVDGVKTGREIFAALSDAPGAVSDATLESFRRKLGLLRRIGAVRTERLGARSNADMSLADAA